MFKYLYLTSRIKCSDTMQRWGTMDAHHDKSVLIRRKQQMILQNQSNADRMHHNQD